MKKCKCGRDFNNVRWYWIEVDGEYQPIGGEAWQDKTDTAKAMKHTDDFKGYYNDKKVVVRSFNHCFNCGLANNETLIEA